MRCLGVLALCLSAGPAPAGDPAPVACRRIAEIDLASARSYDNPYKDVRVTGMVNVAPMKTWAHIKPSMRRVAWELQQENEARSG